MFTKDFKTFKISLLKFNLVLNNLLFKYFIVILVLFFPRYKYFFFILIHLQIKKSQKHTIKSVKCKNEKFPLLHNMTESDVMGVCCLTHTTGKCRQC
jgi:hypothetical protein